MKIILLRLFWLIGSFDYIIGFIPHYIVFKIINTISKPKNETEWYKRSLFLQAIICPVAYVVFLLSLWLWLHYSLVILFIIMVIYNQSIIKYHYTDDQYVLIASNDDMDKSHKLSSILKNIKLATFYAATFIFSYLFIFEK
jgi:membrane-associated HD superfamily phosphohydrolase